MAPTGSLSAANSARALTYSAYISFVPIGIATVLLGPMLPTLAARWDLNYAQQGAVINVQYVASTVGVLLSGVLAARFGFRFAIKIGLLLMGAGVGLLVAVPKPVGVMCVAAYGGGLGLAVPAANLLVAAVNPGRGSATLNILNFCWSLGAVACPFFVAAAVKNHLVLAFLAAEAVVAFLVAMGIAVMPAAIVEPAASKMSWKASLAAVRWTQPVLLALAALFFLYVGVENGFGFWLATYSKSLGRVSPALATAMSSFFYAAMLVGRWLAPALLRLANEIRLVHIGLLMACGGMAALLMARGPGGLVLSACLAGMGLSYVYPITISLLSREFEGSSVLGSVMFTLSNIGGGLLPWMVGVSSNHFASLKAGLAVPLIGCTMMLALYLRRWDRAEGGAAPLQSGVACGEAALGN